MPLAQSTWHAEMPSPSTSRTATSTLALHRALHAYAALRCAIWTVGLNDVNSAEFNLDRRLPSSLGRFRRPTHRRRRCRQLWKEGLYRPSLACWLSSASENRIAGADAPARSTPQLRVRLRCEWVCACRRWDGTDGRELGTFESVRTFTLACRYRLRRTLLDSTLPQYGAEKSCAKHRQAACVHARAVHALSSGTSRLTARAIDLGAVACAAPGSTGVGGSRPRSRGVAKGVSGSAPSDAAGRACARIV